MNLNDFLHQKRSETSLEDRKAYIRQLKKMRHFLEVAKEEQLQDAQNQIKLKFNPLFEYLDEQICEREACIHLKKKYDVKLTELKPNSSEASLEQPDS